MLKVSSFCRVKHGYLGLRSRLSNAWLAQPLLVLVLYIVKLFLLKTTILFVINTVERAVLSECQMMDDMMVWAAQLPQESLEIANRLIENSINSGIRTLMHTTQLMLTAIENLIMFALQMTIGTYACLTVSAVNIAANEAINATESVIRVANSTAADVGHDINLGLGKLSELINSATGLIGTVEDFMFGGNHEIKSVNLTVNKLDHLNISSSINTKLEALRQDVPTYDKTKAAVKAVINEPFEALKKKMNNTNTTVVFQLNRKAQTISAFSNSFSARCNVSKIERNFTTLRHDVSKIITIICVVCVVLILLGMVFNMWKEKSRWVREVAVAKNDDPFVNKQVPHDIIEANMARFAYLKACFLERWLLQHIPGRLWWPVRYSLSQPIIIYCGIGIAGVIISALELLIIKSLQSGASFISEISRNSLDEVTSQVKQGFHIWRNETNSDILSTQSKINTQLLGWVHEGSKGVNASLATFMNSINNEIESVFKGTAFETPLQAVVKCLIGDKVQAVEKGLTWMYNNTEISLPLIPQNVTSIARSSQAPFVKKMESQAVSIFDKAIAAMKKMIYTQFLVSGIFIGVWLIFAIGAFIAAAYSQHPTGNRQLQPQEKSRPPPLEKICMSTTYVSSQNGPPYMSPRVQSPIEKFTNRVTQFFQGPSRQAAMNTIRSPHRGSIILPDAPSTPLKAMFA